jgi:hypothetical protein
MTSLQYFSLGKAEEGSTAKVSGSSIAVPSCMGKRKELAAEKDSHEGCPVTSPEMQPTLRGWACHVPRHIDKEKP